MTDRTGRVRKLTWADVSAARINGTDEIPLLEDLLGTFSELRFNIDLKDEGTIRPGSVRGMKNSAPKGPMGKGRSCIL